MKVLRRDQHHRCAGRVTNYTGFGVRLYFFVKCTFHGRTAERPSLDWVTQILRAQEATSRAISLRDTERDRMATDRSSMGSPLSGLADSIFVG